MTRKRMFLKVSEQEFRSDYKIMNHKKSKYEV